MLYKFPKLLFSFYSFIIIFKHNLLLKVNVHIVLFISTSNCIINVPIFNKSLSQGNEKVNKYIKIYHKSTYQTKICVQNFPNRYIQYTDRCTQIGGFNSCLFCFNQAIYLSYSSYRLGVLSYNEHNALM